MSGFDNGTLQGGVVAQTQQLGAILFGTGAPVPGVGVVGSLYVDTQTYFLYAKRRSDATDPWGNYLFQVPAMYQAGLKWFSTSQPLNTVGVNGDYCLLWGTYPNYGLQPSILGPKAAGVWPTNPTAVAVDVNPTYPAENEHGI